MHYTYINSNVLFNQIQDSGKIPILFKENSGIIQYKSEQEISEQNRTLFSSIKTQNDTFICSIMLIICSLGFSFSYLFPEDSTPLKPALFWVFLALFVISIAYKYQENIRKLFGNKESKIPEQ